jgi:hypothetical protein
MGLAMRHCGGEGEVWALPSVGERERRGRRRGARAVGNVAVVREEGKGVDSVMRMN